jgi:hypothetical protein
MMHIQKQTVNRDERRQNINGACSLACFSKDITHTYGVSKVRSLNDDTPRTHLVITRNEQDKIEHSDAMNASKHRPNQISASQANQSNNGQAQQ